MRDPQSRPSARAHWQNEYLNEPGDLIHGQSVSLLLSTSVEVCAGPPPEMPEPHWDPEPPPTEVERVLFLIGDAGEATTTTSPLLNVLQRVVEEWAGRLDSDGIATFQTLHAQRLR